MARGGRPKRARKHENVLLVVRAAFAGGKYRDTRHAAERKAERQISILEIRQVVERGYHEPAKDEFKEEWQAWNYAIRGRTLDQRELRIVVSFDEEDSLLIITSIDLGPH
jgi:hypothetical protein